MFGKKSPEGNIGNNKDSKGGTAVIEKGEGPITKVDDLESLLKAASTVATEALKTEQQVDSLIERRKQDSVRLKNLELIRESRLQKVENFNPYLNLTINDYKRLTEEGIIDVGLADNLKKMEEIIKTLRDVKYPSIEVKDRLNILVETRNNLNDQIDSQIKQKQEETEARREEVRNKVVETYSQKIEVLEKSLKEIESDPRVAERVKNMKDLDRKKLEIKLAEERQKIILEASRFIQSLTARNENSIKRIGEIIGDKNVENFFNLNDDKEIREEANKIRSAIISSIIEGEGERQLKEPREIVPWKIPSSVDYIQAIHFLNTTETKIALLTESEFGDKKAEKLLEQREKILNHQAIIKHLVGPQWEKNSKNAPVLGTFWAAFDTRKNNDLKGITEARKKDKIEAQNRLLEKNQK